ncbi:MAG: hypothetical protein AAF614_05895 [Chloroflexota bacterium]
MTAQKIYKRDHYQVFDNTSLAGSNSVFDEFGYGLAASGKTLVVGARNQDASTDPAHTDRVHSEILSNVGGAYIYQQQENGRFPNGRWENPVMLLPPELQSSGSFGRSVATNGDTVAVGMSRYDINPETSRSNEGCVYLYERLEQTWQTQPIKQFVGTVKGANFGHTVALSGDLLVIGAPYEDEKRGAVYVSLRQNGRWSEPAKLKRPASIQPKSEFGRTIAAHDNRIVVGVPGSGAGQAFIFERKADGGWKKPINLEDKNTLIPSKRFGRSVSIYGEQVLVGAAKESSAGQAFLFNTNGQFLREFNNPQWVNVDRWRATAARTRQSFGERVALGANIVLVGAPLEHAHVGKSGGRVYLFKFENDEWQDDPIIMESPDLNGNEAVGQFGRAIAIAETDATAKQAIFIGAPLQDPNGKSTSGRVFACQQNENGAWPIDNATETEAEPQTHFFDTTKAWIGRLQNVLAAVETTQAMAAAMIDEMRNQAHRVEDWYELAQINALHVLLQNLHTFGDVQIRNSFRELTVSPKATVPLHKLRKTLTHLSTDLEIIQRALDQRRRLGGSSTGLSAVLLTADVVAAQAIKPARDAFLKTRYVRVVTYLSEVMRVRVLPYDPGVILIGIPTATVAGAQLDSETGNLRQINWDFLALPHEIAHFLYRYEAPDQLSLEKQILSELHKRWATEDWQAQINLPHVSKTVPVFVENWLEELFADIYGCLLAGPILVFGLQDILSDGTEEEMFYDNGLYPVSAIRPFVASDILRQISSDDHLFNQGARSAYKKLVYLETPSKLDENWLAFLNRRFASRPPSIEQGDMVYPIEDGPFLLKDSPSDHDHDHAGKEPEDTHEHGERTKLTRQQIQAILHPVIGLVLEILSKKLYLSGSDFPWSSDAPDLDSLYQTLSKGIPMPLEPFGKLPDPNLYDWRSGAKRALETIDKNLALWAHKGPEVGVLGD